MKTDDPLEQLLAAVAESAKYRHVCPDLVKRLGEQELNRRGNLKIAIKETKNRLHQVAGAYLESTPRYRHWQTELRNAEGREAQKAVCRAIMGEHASTRERLPYLETFYSSVLRDLGVVRSVLDVACGLNPLALLWMPFSEEVPARYEACDLYADMMAFLADAFDILGVEGRAEVRDVVVPPQSEAELTLILKFMPVLQQTQKGTAAEWLRAFRSRYLLVSFPTRSLGGHGKGMAEYYEGWFREVVQSEAWTLHRIEFPNELCFLIER